MKSILLLPIAFLMLLAAGFAGASATIDTSSLPDEFAAGSSYDIPVTVDDVTAFKFKAVYDSDSMTVSFRGLDEGTTPGGREGNQSLLWLSQGESSTSFIVRVVPRKTSTLAFSFDGAQDADGDVVTIPGETVSFRVTSSTPTSISFSDDAGTPDRSGFEDVSSGAGTSSTSVSGTADTTQKTVSPQTTASGETGKTSSESTSKPTETKKTPALGLTGIVAGLAVAGLLRRKI